MPPSPDEEKIDRLRRAMYSRSQSPKLKERPRREMDEGPSIVGEDWKRPEQKMSHSIIAPKGLIIWRHALRWFLIAAVVFSIGAVAFFVYYFTIGSSASSSSERNISISTSGPPTIPGGELTELQISVSNQNSAALQLADLVITYPPGTRQSPNTQYDVPSRRISLGNIAPGEVRQVPVRAVFSGAEGTHANMKVELEYRLAGSSAIFVTSSSYEIVFSSSPLSISIEGNSETVSGQPAELTFTVNSNAAAPIRDVLLGINYPFGFVYSGSDPRTVQSQSAQQNSGLWELGDITPGKSVRVVLRGTLTGESGDERIFRAALGTRKIQDNTGIDTALASNSFKMMISRPFLQLAVSVNKTSGSSVVMRPGDTANVVVDWKNNLPTAVTDAIIVARLSGIEIDGEKVRTNDGFYRSSDNTVLWDKKTTGGALSTLAPEASGSVQFSFIMPDSDALANIRNPRLTISVNAAGKRLSESGVPENLQSAVSQSIKVASNLEVAAQGFYYQNPFGSSGPLPPKAGTETTYAITFSVTNTTSKITGAKLTATMPNYVRWLGKFIPGSEKVSFNANDGTITWDIGDIESGAGLDGAPPRAIAFGIGLTPSASQIGSKPTLIEDIMLTGTDSGTGEEVSRQAADVTTNILGDQGFTATYATVVK